jgi:hypothetical protein
MKNIHLIPTNKPSRLYKQTGALSLDTISDTSKDGISINQHIYITSDEEIKVGGWVIEFQKGDNIGEVHFVNSEYVIASDIQKKIILTTDQDLIKDGVQAIDDEFLEWFVKNPTCERVKIERGKLQIDDDGQEYGFPDMSKYKIIIPKEEEKQDYSGVHLRHCYQGEYEDGCKYGEDDCPAKPLEPKQETLTYSESSKKEERIFNSNMLIKETLEDAMNKDGYHESDYDKIWREGVQFGAKWQAERMYSEEEVYHILCEHTAFLFAGGKSTLSEWFERFKKK